MDTKSIALAISGACFDCRLSKRQHRLALTLASELRSDGPDRSVTLGTGEYRLFWGRSQKRHAGRTRYRRRLRELPDDQPRGS